VQLITIKHSERASCSLVRSIKAAAGKRRIRAQHTHSREFTFESSRRRSSKYARASARPETVHYLSKSNFNWRASGGESERERCAAVGNKNVRGVNNLTHQALTHSAKDWTQLKGSDENYFFAAKCSHRNLFTPRRSLRLLVLQLILSGVVERHLLRLALCM
jgi:hypothetical protein